MDNFPVLETERLRLRKPAVKDIPQLMEYANNPKIADMTLNIPHPYQEKDAVTWLNMANQHFEEQCGFVFAVARLSDDEFMGGIGLEINKRFNRAELGFWIGEPFWNNGLISEAVKEILRFGFEEVGLNKVVAHHLVNNPASGKVMTKNGLAKEGELKEHIRKNGEYLSLVQYGLTQKEYKEMN